MSATIYMVSARDIDGTLKSVYDSRRYVNGSIKTGGYCRRAVFYGWRSHQVQKQYGAGDRRREKVTFCFGFF